MKTVITIKDDNNFRYEVGEIIFTRIGEVMIINEMEYVVRSTFYNLDKKLFRVVLNPLQFLKGVYDVRAN